MRTGNPPEPAMQTWARDRLQPSLLDRLTDERPGEPRDSVSGLVVSRRRLREIVIRDLTWLLNASRTEPEIDFSPYPQARRSTINYGLPAFSGRHATDVKLEDLQAEMRETIIRFEPRVIPGTLEVTGMTMDDDQGAPHNLIVFEIRGQIWSIPYPAELLLKSSIDLETGAVTLQDQLGGG